eukprot:CAMPEP_0170627260 /NCGR_PEP_ID=MMETSP0224-20130122/31870_1 /TAXON_ID=285029 /ORGANISM="Togula jolla, Strain CCCM 725" /LENGTH=442 /DNA_ID=CAMNT_0010954235 /DNA_START=47 /DNA_END=1376 /DNA_ORIENTATION=+
MGAHGEMDYGLVPEDFGTPDDMVRKERLVYDDELHALFARLPAGSFLTLVLDCCHATHMLDVPCSVDTSRRPHRVKQSCTRSAEVADTEDKWQKALVPHALARPRFIPALPSSGPRQRRIPPGSGAHLGRMTLDPGVTAFSFSAAYPGQAALDASVKAHQQGVLSFCLMAALCQLRNRCTYEQMLEKACVKLEDIRKQYMPMMDQFIHMSFCPNSAPSEVVVFDDRYATVAQHRLYQRKRLAERGQSGDGLGHPRMDSIGGTRGPQPQPRREESLDFVPSPVPGQHRPDGGEQGEQMAYREGPPGQGGDQRLGQQRGLHMEASMPPYPSDASRWDGSAEAACSGPPYGGMRAEASSSALSQSSQNIFGMPNLFGSLSNSMPGLYSGAASGGGAPGRAPLMPDRPASLQGNCMASSSPFTTYAAAQPVAFPHTAPPSHFSRMY